MATVAVSGFNVPVALLAALRKLLARGIFFSFSVLPRCSFLPRLGQKLSGAVGPWTQGAALWVSESFAQLGSLEFWAPAASSCLGPSQSEKSGISPGLPKSVEKIALPGRAL